MYVVGDGVGVLVYGCFGGCSIERFIVGCFVRFCVGWFVVVVVVFFE